MDLAWRAWDLSGVGHSVTGMGIRYASAAYRELGGMLRRARERAGLTGTELAHKLDWPLTTISRMEHGKRTTSTTDVILWTVMCGLTLPELQPLLELTRRAERKQGYYLSDERIGGSLQSLIFHESLAEHVIGYEPQVIPGLLQTPAYAQALITAVDPDLSDDWVTGVVRTRMERRRILSLPKAARFSFYIHEHALRLQVGTDKTMAEQLLHLVLMAALGNITVRVVPSAARERSAFGGGFQLMEFPSHRPIVSVDNLRFGGLILEDHGYVHCYQKLVPMLADVALSEGQSRECAANLADVYDRGSQRSVTDVLEEEQLQRRIGNELRGSGVAQEQLQRRRGNELRGGDVEPPTPIYE